ncbi:hypothetical protein [Rubritalea tangerina]
MRVHYRLPTPDFQNDQAGFSWGESLFDKKTAPSQTILPPFSDFSQLAP